MTRSAFTLRLPAEEKAALEHLSQIEGRPINQLLNEAVKSYLSRRGEREQELEDSIALLQAYRQRDPGYRKAMAAFVEAEMTLSDPLEGIVIDGAAKPMGPVQRKMRELMSA